MTGVEPLEAPRLVSLMLVLSPAAVHGLDQGIQDTAAETRSRRSESVVRRHGSGTELQAAGNHLPVSSSPSCKLCTREAVCCVYRSQSRCGCLWWNPSLVATRQCQAAEVTAHSCPWRSWHEAEATTSAATTSPALCHRGQRLPGDDGYTDEHHVGGFRFRFSGNNLSCRGQRLLRCWDSGVMTNVT